MCNRYESVGNDADGWPFADDHPITSEKRWPMFEKLRIKDHMEVADASGRHIGTVDNVVDERIKLTHSDSIDGAHYFIAIDQVDRIIGNRIYLKLGTPIPIVVS